jgi:phage-related protein
VSPDRAGELGDIAASAYRDAWGESLGDVTNVVTGLETSFEGLGNADLDRLTGQAIALGQAFEVDTAQGIQTASELVSSGLASSADEAFDLLTRGLQEMPQGIRDELFAASNEYGDFFADLGISGDVAFAKLAEYADDGIYGIDKFGDALKELTIRGTDMSDASSAAYDAAGLSMEDMANRFLAGGDDARSAVEDLVAGLLTIEDPAEQANAAIALFGTPLEDLSVSEIPGVLEGLTDLESGMGGVEGAAGDMADTLGGTTSAKIESFKRKALGALADFAAKELIPRFEQVVGWFEQNWPQIKATGEQVFAGIRSAWESVGRPVFDGVIAVAQSVAVWFQENWPQIRAVLESVFTWLAEVAWPAVQTVFSALTTAAQAVADWFVDNWPQIRSVIDTVFTWLTDVAWPAVSEVLGFMREQFQVIVDWVAENWPKIQETIETVLGAIRTVIETVLGAIRVFWETFGDAILTAATVVWDAIKIVVETAINSVLAILDTVMALITGDWEGAWNGIKDFVSGIWDGITEFVDTAIRGIWTTIDDILGGILRTFERVWDAIAKVVDDTWEDIKGFINGALDAIGTAIDTLRGGWETAWGLIESAVSTAASGIETILGPFIELVQRAIDLAERFTDLNPFDGSFLGFGGSIDLSGAGSQSSGGGGVPKLASGGVISSPTLALVGEYAGARSNPEIVAPRSMMMDSMRSVLRESGSAQGDSIAVQINGDVRLDDTDVDGLARRVNFAMMAA